MRVMLSNPQPMPARRQHGVSLLEVLVAMLILSLGLLGLANLQTVGLRNSHGATLISQASLLAYDIADRIRANPQGAAAFAGFVTDCPAAMPAGPLVAAELAEWSCSVENLLPAGVGRIAGAPNGNGMRYTITLEWRDPQLDDAADPWTSQLVIDV
jgi:type IV pilus assembly protein PilV